MSRVMLVDDEESILKSLKRILRLAPCTFGGKSFTLEVETYSSPLEALEAARHDDYDLFVSDYRMPVMDGIEFLQAVRSNPNTKKAAFIILTAQGDRALVQKAAALGANNVLAKPFTIEKMKAAIEAVFGALK